MKTGIFITREERVQLEMEYKTSGMYLSGGLRLGNPEEAVARLVDKYKPPKGSGINLRTGEFETP
jgi:hypothetical protein